ncbi:NAD(P)-dependent oxidoreductase [Aphelenchoides besseyi]|nr:NAD(P)-dependent oxidoreductase [Aphelenchoides besseyi]
MAANTGCELWNVELVRSEYDDNNEAVLFGSFQSFFRGKSVIISGASRGIGLAIAKKLAADGAKVSIFAKTVKPHPQLPGTIYTAAEELKAAGALDVLPLPVDIRDEDAVRSAVEKTVQKFGGIDYLVNSASAVSPTPTLKTDMKRYDLMHSINTRGTFLVSKMCIPHLQKSEQPQIMNLSPPLCMESQWFAPHLAYTMSKYGMSLCVLGMSEEFKDSGIAVNALWPKTLIWTAAMKIVSPDPNTQRGCRKPEIMADAAYHVLQQKYTGKFVIDEEVLREAGITNFDQYAYDPTAKLIPDGFIPGGRALL